MARNSEKAHSMLFRFRAAQAAEAGIIDINRMRRPKLITSVTSIAMCEKWRSQVVKEISRKVTKIQDPALSDFQIRDLNDEINKLMREKHVWESQIRGLGGPNYMRGGRVLDEEGREVPGGGKGYRYFGRARELPGVKELFERQARPEDDMHQGRERRGELRQKVDAGYYGYNLDEEDGTLLAYEAAKEKEARDSFLALGDDLSEKEEEEEEEKEEEEKKKKKKKNNRKSKMHHEWMELPGDAGDGARWRVPTMEEVEAELVDRKRRRMLERFD